jgi:formylglycine-generating enzyme required for sulfatase activity
VGNYLRLPRPTLWLVKGDTFEMGGDGPDESPRFTVELGSFYLSKSPVTNEEYEAFAPGHERGPTAPGDRDPVVNVSFDDALEYCHWYAVASGKPFRLPTEAEWEHACRAGTRTRYFWGDDWSGGTRHVQPADRCREVETLAANPFGLHDMLGNVWEWTASLLAPYPVVEADGRDDPERPGPRTIRGGSFRTTEIGCAARGALDRGEKRDDLGFRIVRSL